jgi:hypothetical protein
VFLLKMLTFVEFQKGTLDQKQAKEATPGKG